MPAVVAVPDVGCTVRRCGKGVLNAGKGCYFIAEVERAAIIGGRFQVGNFGFWLR